MDEGTDLFMHKSMHKSRVFRALSVRILLFFLSFLILFSLNISLADNHTITNLRAGFWSFDGYHNIDESGNRSGYGYDLLQLIARYANVHYTYLGFDKTLGESLELLEKGEIDLISGVKMTPERIDRFDFSSRNVGDTSTILTVKEGNISVVNGDYSTYDGLRIGLINDGLREKEMDDFAKEHNFSYEAIPFNTTQEMAAALQMGEVDALVSSSLRKLENEWTIDVFNESPIYIAVKKGDYKTLNLIDDAMDRMELEEYHWRTNLDHKYYNSAHTSLPLLTVSERQYLEDNDKASKTFSVLVNLDRYPYSYLENGAVKGIMVDLFARIAEISGIKYEWIITESREEYAECLSGQQADIVIDLTPDFDSAEKLGYKITSEYLTAPFSWIRRTDSDGDIYVAAKLIYTARTPAQFAYENNFHNIEYISYSTEEECLRSVIDGDTDAYCAYTYNAEKIILNDVSGKLSTFVAQTENKFAIGISKYNDYRLTTILNAAISCIEDWEVTEITRRYTAMISPSFSFIELLRSNPSFHVIGILSIISIVFFVLFSSEQFRHHKSLKNTIHSQRMLLDDSLQNMLDVLATAIEFRSSESGYHVQRTREIVLALLKKLRKTYPREFRFSDNAIRQIASAAVLHDVGKIAIPDHILNKPGKLTNEEFEIIKQHTIRGCSLLESIPDMQHEPLYQYAWDICRWHHERWDGKGYPDGLVGEEIPIWTQVASIADVYDALTASRVYKTAYSPEKAIEMIVNGECGSFNPKLLNVFLSVAPQLHTETRKSNEPIERAPSSSNITSLVLNSFKLLLDNTDSLIFVKDTDLVYRAVSPGFAKAVGLPSEKIMYRSDRELLTDQDLIDRFVNEDYEVLSTGDKFVGKTEIISVTDGLSNYGYTTKYPIRDSLGRNMGILGITKDITAQYYSQRHHQITLKYLHTLPKDMYLFICIDVTGWHIVGEKRQMINGVEFSAHETIEEFSMLSLSRISDRRGEAFTFYSNFNFSSIFDHYHQNRSNFSMEYIRIMPTGIRKWVRDDVNFLIDPVTGHLCMTIGVYDIQERKEDQHRLIMQAERDALTNLLNRGACIRLCNERLFSAENEKHALFMIDIDNYKLINDTLGHVAGDQFLSTVGKILMDNFRSSDILGRIGGDEFIILMTDVTNEKFVHEKAEQLKQAFGTVLETVFRAIEKVRETDHLYDLIEDAYEQARQNISSVKRSDPPRISASIGISLFPQDGSTREELYAHADEAMYRVKRMGKNGYLFYSSIKK